MKSNYEWTLRGSIVCLGASVTDKRTGHEVVRIDFQGQNGRLLARRAMRIIAALDKVDREDQKRG